MANAHPHHVSIFDLVYVGVVTAGWLVEQGHVIIGAVVGQVKVDAFKVYRTPISLSQ
jgi:UDP-glucose 6-dehydrogenase